MRRAFVTAGLLATFFAWPAAGQTSQPVVNVQIINVCDDNGNNCALSNPYASYGYSPAAITDIFRQAGITVNVLAPVQYDNSAYLNPAVIDDPTHGYLTGSPTDAAHQLMDLPGHMQNTDRQVLNVFAVDTLPHTTSSGATASQLFGLGLENANGAVVTTGLLPGSNTVAGLDNIAHELGHNLGLYHVDGTSNASAYDLMQGIGRAVPHTLCGIAGVSCDANGSIVPTGDPTTATIGQKDTLQPFQAAQTQLSANSLFSIDQLSPSLGPLGFGTGCDAGSTSCLMNLQMAQSTSSLSLVGFKMRFLDQPGSTGYVPVDAEFNLVNPSPSCTNYLFNDPSSYSQTSSVALPGGGTEVSVTIDPNCLGQGSAARMSFGVAQGDESVISMKPFSIELDYSNLVTSTALFDQSGVALTDTPAAIGMAGVDPNGLGLGVPSDPTAFNAVSGLIEDGGVTLSLDAVDVPEAPSVALLAGQLAFGLLAWGLAGRRRGL